MTAASAFCGPTAAYLLTDAGSFDASGTIIEIRSKILASDRLRIAAVMAGVDCIAIVETPDGDDRYSPADDVRKLMEDAVDQRGFLAALPDVMRETYAVAEQIGDGFFQFTIALWNAAAARPETYVIGTPGHTFPGLPPFALAGANPSVMPPVDRSLWPSPQPTRGEVLAIIEQQRRTPREDGTIHVGGFAELTTVDAAGVHTETIHRWPDRIGHMIDPATSWFDPRPCPVARTDRLEGHEPPLGARRQCSAIWHARS